MGRFKCTVCAREYYEKRFLWEEDSFVEPACKEDDSVQDGVPQRNLVQKPGVVDNVGTYADAVSATGTVADAVGTTVTGIGSAVTTAGTAVAVACEPLSALGGVVGVAGGALQLTQGLTMPSGRVDRHLVVKGGVNMGVGSTCLALSCCAAFVPPLIFVALGLGAASVGTTGILDATMSGLCCECRVKRPADHKIKDDVALELDKAKDESAHEWNKAEDDVALEWGNNAYDEQLQEQVYLGKLSLVSATTGFRSRQAQ